MPPFKDITGQKFGRLTAIEYKGNSKWLFDCECGNQIIARISNVSRGATQSCGCLRKERKGPKLYNFVDISGCRYGRLQVLKYVGEKKWLCVCDCGNEVITTGKNLRSGNTKSCGCLQSDNRRRKRVESPAKKSAHYSRWTSMKSRCENPRDPSYANYGGRGIKVCKEWHDFNTFRKWAESSGYEKGLTIDRIDVNGDYCPENCRWATNKEQQRNKRCNVVIEHNGERKCASEWAEKFNVDPENIIRAANGMFSETVDERLSRYESGRKQTQLLINIGGVVKTTTEWEKISGIPKKIICHRLERGWVPLRAVFQKLRKRGGDSNDS